MTSPLVLLRMSDREAIYAGYVTITFSGKVLGVNVAKYVGKWT